MATKKHHNMYGTPTYKSWAEMKYRCGNVKRKNYLFISYAKEWEDFRIFFSDMGIRPKDTSLDRIDNNGNYCRENCRWATRTQQARNTRKSRKFRFKGNNLSLPEWAEVLGVGRSTLAQRIYTYHWPLERALKGGY